VLIISADEPQLEQCLASVHNQKRPFRQIVHINNVIPHADAVNQGVKELTGKWTVLVGGDMILFPDASEIFNDAIRKNNDKKTCSFQFKLYDPFLDMKISGCNLTLAQVLRDFPIKNVIANDIARGEEIKKAEWIYKWHPHLVVGTHCKDPSDFQIFHRFYVAAIKGVDRTPRLHKLLEITGDEKYRLALKAYEFGVGKEYPGSHNIQYEMEKYEEFKEWIYPSSSRPEMKSFWPRRLITSFKMLGPKLK